MSTRQKRAHKRGKGGIPFADLGLGAISRTLERFHRAADNRARRVARRTARLGQWMGNGKLIQRRYSGPNVTPWICVRCRERAGNTGSVFVDRVFLTEGGWFEHREVIHAGPSEMDVDQER